MAEYALVTLLLRDDPLPVGEWKAQVLDLLADAYRDPAIVRSLPAIPSSAAAHAWIVEALSAGNLDSPVPARSVLDALTARSQTPADTGFGRLEAVYLRHRLTTVIGHSAPPNPLRFDWGDPCYHEARSTGEMYEMAHSVLYLTDFGRYTWPDGQVRLLERRDDLTASLRRVGERCRRERLWDLVGEAALALRCLDPAATVGPLLGAIGEAQLPDGAIPAGPAARGVEGHYHATLVALLAFAVWARSERPQPPQANAHPGGRAG
jgi:hypothetical protein